MGVFDAFKNFGKLGLFGKESESVLGIDIGSSAIKIVQLKRKHGSAVLETYGELALGPYAELAIGQVTSLPTDRIVAALSDLLKESSATTRSAGVSIPFTSSLVAFAQMPELPEKQLPTMIPIEARKYIPVPIAEVALDWFVIPKEDKQYSDEEAQNPGSPGKIDVLLVAIHNEVLQNYKSITSRTGVQASFFEIEIFSSIRATLEQTVTPTAILDMGAASTKLYVVEYGIVKSSHLINKGGQDVTLAIAKSLGMTVPRAEAQKRELGLSGLSGNESVREAMLLVLDQIFSEAGRVILNYQKKSGKNIGKAVLTGGGATLKGLSDLAGKHLETAVVLADPFARTESPAFLANVLKQVGPEFAVAVGLALRKLQEFD